MQQGKTLIQLATELERQLETRKDYLAPVGRLALVANEPDTTSPVQLHLANTGTFDLNRHAHGQLGDHVGIPSRYYERMLKEAPQLLATNVNEWLQREPKTRRMVRTLDGTARAFLSDRYRPLDNHDLAEVVLPELMRRGAKVVSAELTEQRLYIKAVLDALEMTVPGSRQVGDVVQAGLVISNSEVGAGALRIEPMTFRLVCLNGAIAPTAMKRYHVGRIAELETEVRAVLSDESRKADDKALWLKVRDVVRAAWDKDLFVAQVTKMAEAAEQKIESSDIGAVIEAVQERFSFSDEIGKSILKNLIEGGDLSRYGLMNAVTAVANSEEVDYETGTDLQRAGGQIVELPQGEWRKIAEAA